MAKPDNKPESAKSADLVEAAESTAGIIKVKGLIKVKKDAETLHVHPDALAEHVKLGWKAAE